jgi:hypothetical protein
LKSSEAYGVADLPSKNSTSQNWGPHVAVVATKEDPSHEQRARFSEEQIVGILKETRRDGR